jgi:uncharacterized protein
MTTPFRIAGRPPRESTQADFDAFGAVCDRLSGFDDDVDLYRVDGWLTALAAGPLRPDTEVWLALLFGDTFDRVFADPPDRAHAVQVLQARLDVLHDALDAEELLAAPDALRLDPFLDEWTDEDRQRLVDAGATSEAEAATMQAGTLWADGVLTGLEALAELWHLPQGNAELERAYEAIEAQVQALVAEDDDEAWPAFLARYYPGRTPEQPPERDDLIAEALYAVQDLRVLLLDFGPRPEMRRVAPQPGRNELCPCGSGRKYKKCHGAGA